MHIDTYIHMHADAYTGIHIHAHTYICTDVPAHSFWESASSAHRIFSPLRAKQAFLILCFERFFMIEFGI